MTTKEEKDKEMASRIKRKLAETANIQQQQQLLPFAKVPKRGITTTTSSSSSQESKRINENVKFDKEKWIESLSTEQKDLLKLEIDTLDESWLSVLYPELTKPYFIKLKKFIKTEESSKKTTIFPPKEMIYSWSRLTPLNNVKVVILGQDPYHNFNQAHGLAFSVLEPTIPPPSLKNIFIALHNDYPNFKPKFINNNNNKKSGDLTLWAKRGVLLLNSCLTVRAHEANSHANHGWETFTEAVLLAAAAKQSICFMAWGSYAAKRIDKISSINNKHHHDDHDLILKSVHPSPLSASRGFFNCHHFKIANDWLIKKYGIENGPINWSLDPQSSIFE